MKIVCKKNSDVRQMLQKIQNLLEKECLDYPILEEELVIEIKLRDAEGLSSPRNAEQVHLDEVSIQEKEAGVSMLEYYYNADALTSLYNRAKYERDIIKFERKRYGSFACIYMDVIGLHEINNHLGHTEGDRMLCSVADGIRRYFVNGHAYRIGGDEFVVFCFDWEESHLEAAISDLKQALSKDEYEISVGLAIDTQGRSMTETINRAENIMRDDKAEFYRQSGAKRQMRSLNHKLEKILLENQDTSQFLKVIADEYKGVYMVNPDEDTCRHIYVPPYFQALLKKYQGCYSKAIGEYCRTLVRKEDQHLFDDVFNYEYVLAQLKQGKQISFTYQKTDGSTIRLQITVYNQNVADSKEMLWVFIDGDKS